MDRVKMLMVADIQGISVIKDDRVSETERKNFPYSFSITKRSGEIYDALGKISDNGKVQTMLEEIATAALNYGIELGRNSVS